MQIPGHLYLGLTELDPQCLMKLFCQSWVEVHVEFYDSAPRKYNESSLFTTMNSSCAGTWRTVAGSLS